MQSRDSVGTRPYDSEADVEECWAKDGRCVCRGTDLRLGGERISLCSKSHSWWDQSRSTVLKREKRADKDEANKVRWDQKALSKTARRHVVVVRGGQFQIEIDNGLPEE